MRETGCGAPHPTLANIYCSNFHRPTDSQHGPYHTAGYAATNTAGGVTGEYVSWPVKKIIYEERRMITDSDKGKELVIFTTGCWEFSGKVVEIDNDNDWLVLKDDGEGTQTSIDMCEIAAVKRRNW